MFSSVKNPDGVGDWAKLRMVFVAAPLSRLLEVIRIELIWALRLRRLSSHGIHAYDQYGTDCYMRTVYTVFGLKAFHLAETVPTVSHVRQIHTCPSNSLQSVGLIVLREGPLLIAKIATLADVLTKGSID